MDSLTSIWQREGEGIDQYSFHLGSPSRRKTHSLVHKGFSLRHEVLEHDVVHRLQDMLLLQVSDIGLVDLEDLDEEEVVSRSQLLEGVIIGKETFRVVIEREEDL